MSPEICRSVFVGILVWWMLVIPFALPGFIRIARDMWHSKHAPFPRTVAVVLLLAVAYMCAASAALAMLDGFGHLKQLEPAAFGLAVLIGLGSNVCLIVVEFIRLVRDRSPPPVLFD